MAFSLTSLFIAYVKRSAVALLALSALLVSVAVHAQRDENGFKFDHFQTGFALEGAHATLECESCHSRGVFQGTPTQCVSCHMEGGPVNASAKNPQHMQTLDQCEDCHTPQEWTFVARVDHGSVLGACRNCHNENNFYAEGKPADHINVGSTDCDACHLTQEWVEVRFDHDTVAGQACISCHDGVSATGKHPLHLATSDTCDNCHTTVFWEPVNRFDHTDGIVASQQCVACHDGSPNNVAQGAEGKHALHLPTSNTCDNCHSSVAWEPVTRFDHADSVVSGQQCVACHDGSPNNVAQGAEGKHALHLPTSNTCDTCHSSVAWEPVTRFDHADSVVSGQQCVACHDGLPNNVAQGAEGKHALHLPTSNTCDNCHSTVVWEPVTRFDHSDSVVSGQQCVACHDGSPNNTGQGAEGKHALHLATSNTCDNCHITSMWQDPAFDHGDNVVASQQCIACHDGSPNNVAQGALGKSSSHWPSSNNCESCHISTIDWATVQMDHGELNPPNPSFCSACHSGDKGPHPINPVSNECVACHANTMWSPAVRVDHGEIPETNCVLCHYQGNTLPSGSNVSHKLESGPWHINTSDECTACHMGGAGVTWSGPVVTLAQHNDTLMPNLDFGNPDTCRDCHTSSGFPADCAFAGVCP